jgi:hypothetical protein
MLLKVVHTKETATDTQRDREIMRWTHACMPMVCNQIESISEVTNWKTISTAHFNEFSRHQNTPHQFIQSIACARDESQKEAAYVRSRRRGKELPNIFRNSTHKTEFNSRLNFTYAHSRSAQTISVQLFYVLRSLEKCSTSIQLQLAAPLRNR